MTSAVADNFPRRDRAELARWGLSLAAVLLLHVGAGLYLLWVRVPVDAGGAPPAAVMIDMAPLPAPPQPVPEPVVEPQPQPLVPPPLPPLPDIPLPQVEPSPAPKPAIALPKPPPKVQPKAAQRSPETLPEHPPPAAAPAAPPSPAPPAVNAGAATASWQAQLVGWLERYKRYPRLAREQHQEGVAYLRFTMDRSGRVLAAQIDKGSGFALLDEEVTALVQRAQPLPAPPPEVQGATLTLTLPVQFSLRNGRR